jgi:hypothetical protein
MLEVDLSQKCEIEFHDLAVMLILQLSASFRFKGLLVASAPVDVLVSDHRSACYSLVCLDVGTPVDPFASLDLAGLGSTQIVLGLSCWGRVMSDVVGSGWIHVTFLRTAGVGSPGLASLVP